MCKAAANTCTMRWRATGLLAVSTLAAFEAAAAPSEQLLARVFPVKAVRFIVAAPPNGTADAVARLIAPRMHDAWHQPVVVDNRPGANGIIGTEMTARAAPDGYTIAMSGAGLVLNPSLYTRVPYDPVRDFVPVAQAISVPSVLVVHPSLGVAGVAEFVQAARAKPGTIVFGSGGRGTPGHLALELFQSMAAVRFGHVPHKSGSHVLHELLGGQVQASFASALSVMPHVRAGRLKGMAVTSPARTRAAPELPTLAESGYPGFEVTGWFGVLAPARTPAAIVTKINAEVVRILRVPEIEQRLASQAADVVAGTPEAFARHIAAESQRWARLVKQAGIKPN